ETKNPLQPPKPQWEGDNIFLPKSVFDALKKILGPEGAQIRLQSINKKFIEAKKANVSEKIRVPKDYGILQVNVNFQGTSFLFGLLKEVVGSKEKAILGFPYEGQIKIEKHVPEGQEIHSTPFDDILRNPGQTFLSKDLQRKIYGGLLKPG